MIALVKIGTITYSPYGIERLLKAARAFKKVCLSDIETELWSLFRSFVLIAGLRRYDVIYPVEQFTRYNISHLWSFTATASFRPYKSQDSNIVRLTRTTNLA